MENTGWIKFHRKFNDWEWYQDPKMVQFWIHLLIHANHKSKNWKNWIIPAGSLVIGRLRAASVLGTSEQCVRTCIERLKKSKSITTISTNKFTIITIVDWEHYQNGVERSTNKQPPRQPTNNHEPANTKPTKNQPFTTSKETINININSKELKNDKTPTLFADECFQIFEKIVPLFPDEHKPSDPEKWMSVLDQLHRLDGYAWDEIFDVLAWARNHEFWNANCLSVLPLRKKSNNTGVSKFKTMHAKFINESTKKQSNENNRQHVQKDPSGGKKRGIENF